MADQERDSDLSSFRRAPKTPMSKSARRTLIAVLTATLLAGYVIGANLYMTSSTRDQLYMSPAELPPSTQADAIVILGAGVRENGEPSDALRDRLQTGQNI